MVDFIRRENIKSLVAHLMEHFGDLFQSVDYVQVRVLWFLTLFSSALPSPNPSLRPNPTPTLTLTLSVGLGFGWG